MWECPSCMVALELIEEYPETDGFFLYEAWCPNEDYTFAVVVDAMTNEVEISEFPLDDEADFEFDMEL